MNVSMRQMRFVFTPQDGSETMKVSRSVPSTQVHSIVSRLTSAEQTTPSVWATRFMASRTRQPPVPPESVRSPTRAMMAQRSSRQASRAIASGSWIVSCHLKGIWWGCVNDVDETSSSSSVHSSSVAGTSCMGKTTSKRPVSLSAQTAPSLAAARLRHEKSGPRAHARSPHRFWWRCGESNSGPKQTPDRCLQAQPVLESRMPCTRRPALGIPAGSVLASGIPATSGSAAPSNDAAPQSGACCGLTAAS